MKEESSEPALVLEYTDPVENFKGWFVRDTATHRLCAGGMRIQAGLTRGHLVRMARNMGCKMRIWGLRVDGAKCGLCYDPAAPGKNAAIARFLKALQPYIESCYSMGPDLNVEMATLEEAARGIGIPSVKMAICRAQGWEMPYFLERNAVLRQPMADGWTLGKIRAGYGVAAATLAVLDFLKIAPASATVAIQGFGTLAKGAIHTLLTTGVRIIAIADARHCYVATSTKGLDLDRLLLNNGPLLPATGLGPDIMVKNKNYLGRIPCDVLIPAAVEHAITSKNAAGLQVRAVAPGANLAVTAEAEQILYKRGIIVLPDFLAGSGGSLCMEGLFGPENHPQPEAVLQHMRTRMAATIKEILTRSASQRITPAEAALEFCNATAPEADARPYGKAR